MAPWPSLATLVLLAAPASGGAAPGLPLVGDAALAAAAESCLGLSADAEADRRMIESRGWKAANGGSDGKAPARSARIEYYGRDGMVLVLNVEDKPTCLILTRSAVSRERLEGLATAALGAPSSTDAGGLMWILKTRQNVLLRAVADGDDRLVTFFFTSSGQKN